MASLARTMAGKRTKSSVNYSRGMGSTRCGNCAYYSAGTCQLVEGLIDPDFWCELFKRARA